MKRFPELFLCLAGLLMVGVGRWYHSGAFSSLKEVHEWGTMTSVAGSDGRQFEWWSQHPQESSEQVPKFVHDNPIGGKTSFSYVQRMETPVLYFYPTKPMTVEVSVRFEDGRITEFFPSITPMKTRDEMDTKKTSGPITWKLDLLPPEDKAGKMILPVEGQGPQYVHAREVPDSWLVRRKPDGVPSVDNPAVDEVEKFLFYRGASDISTGVIVPRGKGNSISLMSYFSPLYYGENPTPAWWILQVSGKRSSWKRFSSPVKKDAEGWPEADVEIPGLPESGVVNLEKTVSELREDMLPELTRAGLSRAEATAMLNTWNDTWFKESGTRILFLLPQKWVDQMLPLEIKPQPQKVKRVFMARVEMLSPKTEQTLLELVNQSVLNPNDCGSPDQVKRMKELEMGRFTDAAFQRVFNIRKGQMENAAFYMKVRLED